MHDELSAELLALAGRLRQVSDQGETDLEAVWREMTEDAKHVFGPDPA